MTAPEIVNRLRGYGVAVWVEGGRLLVEAAAKPPAEALALVEQLKARKDEALRALQPWDEAEAHRLMCELPVRIHQVHGGRHIPHSPESGAACDALHRLREQQRDMAGFRAALEHYVVLRVAQAAEPEPTPAPADWDQPRACELLVGVQVRLKALLGDAPIPELDLVTGAAYQGLAAAHEGHDWPGFLAALDAFEKVWRGRIARH